jgi:hypothetical protein
MKPGLATIVPRDQESGEIEAGASSKRLFRSFHRGEGAEMSQATVLAAEQNTRAMERASWEAQQVKIAAMDRAKRIDEMDPGEF